jgi:hypothetical protein
MHPVLEGHMYCGIGQGNFKAALPLIFLRRLILTLDI